MKVVTRPLARSGLAARLLAGDEAVLRLYPAGDPRRPESYLGKAREVDGRVGRADRERVVGGLAGGGADREARLDAFVSRGGYLVTTGQQPALLGGPLFGLYKALTAAALARRLERLLDRPVLPVFWIASEDHDWEEARTVHLLDTANQLRSVELPPRSELSRPLHRIPVGAEIAAAAEAFLALLPATEFTPAWADLVEKSCVPGTTLPASYGALLGALLGPAGVFLVQAHDPAIKERSLALLLAELAGSAEREGALRDRVREIERAGETPQVPIPEGATNLFLETEAGRERILREGNDFRLRASGELLSRERIEEIAREDPARLTPNVLLRPVVEASVLPTLAYVGGPAEVAYLAQVAPIFREHRVAPPVVHPRASLAIVEAKVGKVLDKFGLAPEELGAGESELATRVLAGALPAELAAALDEAHAATARATESLRAGATALDPTLGGAVDSFGKQTASLLHELERKVQASLRRKNETSLAQVEKARANLFPTGKPQERVLSPFQYLARYGSDFLSRVSAEVEEAVLPPADSRE